MWEKVNQPDEASQWRGDIPIYHRYTLGVAGERFFRALRDERAILASRCPRCRDAFLPPRLYCERCFQEASEFFPVSGPGYVKSFTVLHRSLDEASLAQPETVALIAWRGIRGGLVHRLGDISPADVRTGMAVEPVWAEERQGALQDIRYFRPVA